MDRYEVMAGKMAPLTDGAHRKWGFTGKVETRSYERLVDALIDFVETGDGLKARFLTGLAACLAADRKSVENRGFGVAVRKVRCHRGKSEGGRTHHGHHVPVQVVHGKAKAHKLVDAADHIGYEWTGRAHGSLADALATLAVQRWLEQWLVAE